MKFIPVTRSAPPVESGPSAPPSAARPHAPPFPADVFPAPVREYIESAPLLNYPTDFVGMAALTGFAAAIGDTHHIEAKRGWRETATVFGAIVGNAGVRKTAALSFALWPLRKRQQQLSQRYEQEREAHRQELRRLKLLKSDEEPPSAPRLEQIITENLTSEALISLLHANPRGVLSWRDELASWTRDLNRYSQGSDEQLWLSLWSAQSITYNRKSQGEHLYLPRPVISVIGGVQPAVLPELFSSGKSTNGFSDRILFVYPDPIPRQFVDEEVSDFVRDRYGRVFEKLFDLTWAQDEEGLPKPHVVRLSPEARRRFIEWNNTFINKLLNSPDLPEREKSVISKLEGYSLRFALILHLVECAYGDAHGLEVQLSTLEKALRLTDYFLAMARKVLAAVGQPTVDDFTHALNYVKQRGGTITKRDLYRSKVGGINTEEKASAFFREVQTRALGTVTVRTSDHGGPATEELHLSQ